MCPWYKKYLNWSFLETTKKKKKLEGKKGERGIFIYLWEQATLQHKCCCSILHFLPTSFSLFLPFRTHFDVDTVLSVAQRGGTGANSSCVHAGQLHVPCWSTGVNWGAGGQGESRITGNAPGLSEVMNCLSPADLPEWRSEFVGGLFFLWYSSLNLFFLLSEQGIHQLCYIP